MFWFDRFRCLFDDGTMLLRLALLALWLLGLFSSPAVAAGHARYVVVLVWDGMRPDFVTEQLTPILYQLAQEGVTFQNHHSTYPSATEVNGTAIATGAYPSRSGLIANREYRPDIDPLKPFGTESLAAVRKGDELSRGHYLNQSTIAEIVQGAGRKTAIAGTKPVALLHDRAERRAGVSSGINLFEGHTLPTDVLERLIRLQGNFPAADKTKIKRDVWTTQALTGPLWDGEVPQFSLLWLSEPDFSQHETGPGSERSLKAIKSSDQNLGRVLHALEAKGIRDTTDVLIVSDHGFSTISRTIDIATSLKQAGFNAAREFKTSPSKDDILVASNGGSVLLYVAGHDEKLVERLVSFAQGEEYAGVIFTRRPMRGTFTLEQAHLNTPNPPDAVISLRWTAAKNTNGVPGMVFSDDSSRAPGQGMHVSLSRFDMHNTLIAAGPDFRRGIVDPLPSGNSDIAPTVLWILGIKPPKRMDGRVLTEALIGSQSKIKSFQANRLEATHEHERFAWHQYLNVTELDGVVYFDEGNGHATPK